MPGTPRPGARAWTTDYIIDETATLLKARNLGHLCTGLFALLDQAQALVFSYVDEERFRRSRSFFEKHPDHGYSFTECTSFCRYARVRNHQGAYQGRILTVPP